mmetsp:Transcript_24987/g.77152  ORF Transcript_24987/g.77152 Transcript_24987/m.77152 type:complete len:244 (+) Transcript_24987:291-1022(+)
MPTRRRRASAQPLSRAHRARHSQQGRHLRRVPDAASQEFETGAGERLHGKCGVRGAAGGRVPRGRASPRAAGRRRRRRRRRQTRAFGRQCPRGDLRRRHALRPTSRQNGSRCVRTRRAASRRRRAAGERGGLRRRRRRDRLARGPGPRSPAHAAPRHARAQINLRGRIVLQHGSLRDRRTQRRRLTLRALRTGAPPPRRRPRPHAPHRRHLRPRRRGKGPRPRRPERRPQGPDPRLGGLTTRR